MFYVIVHDYPFHLLTVIMASSFSGDFWTHSYHIRAYHGGEGCTGLALSKVKFAQDWHLLSQQRIEDGCMWEFALEAWKELQECPSIYHTYIHVQTHTASVINNSSKSYLQRMSLNALRYKTHCELTLNYK